MLVLIFLATVQLFHSASAQSCPPSWVIGQPVKTTSGSVQGHAASNAITVSEYLGIPYAEPPVGIRRFQPPVRYNGNGILRGDRFGFSCIPSNITSDDSHVAPEIVKKYNITEGGLKFLNEIIHPGLQYNEDCLTLNVWAKPQSGERRKAVLVWIHGGSFVTGSSALPSYNGQFFAEQEDVILVTIKHHSYRLSIFGFPGNPLGNQNLGLLDQRLAIEWVRDNIAAFGGDPLRITLFGQSAGGVSIDDYTYAWPCDPIVHGVISQSGTSTGISNRTMEQAADYWFNSTMAIGCGNKDTNSTQDIYNCMLGVSSHDIAKSLVDTVNSTVAMPYSPTMDNEIVFSDLTNRTAAAVPMLIGSTDFEFGLFELFTDQDVPQEFWRNQGNIMFGCPAGRRAAISAAKGNPTWRYRYFADFPNLELSTNPPSGAYHESEVPMLFNTVPKDGLPSWPQQVDIGNYMRGAWAAFAKDPVHGLEKYGWPRYQANESTLIRIGFENKVGSNLANPSDYDATC